MRKYSFALAALLISAMAIAQIKMPPASPTFELKGTVGLADVKVVYSRPSARGRQVAGVLITYALYTQFTEETATIILSKNLTWWGAIGYDKKDDLLRFDVPVKHPSSMYETFTISFSDFTMNSANLNMKWEHTKAMFTIESDVDSKVMADIKAQVIDKNPSNAGVYFQAAGYYYDTERDSKLALEWVNKAIAGSNEEQYWVIHLKAKLQARLGMNKEAIASAQKSMALAKTGGNPDYVRLNEKLIASLK
mgnify:CR=1 FL=1